MKMDLSKIRHVALDLDGTIYKGGTLFDFTKPFLALLDELDLGYTFLTNNPSKSVKDYIAHLKNFGIEADANQLYTSTLCTMEFLREKYPAAKRIFALGTPSMCQEFSDAGFILTTESHLDEPDLVIVAFDLTLNYQRLCRAAYWIKKGKPFIGTNPDRVCPTDQPTVLVDCGSICACIEAATGIAPAKVLGKPNPQMLRGILGRHFLKPHELAMVGDRIYTDVAMAKQAGAFGVLVLTGEATAQDAARQSPAPDLVLPSLKEFGDKLRDAKAQMVAA
ncbi:MAG: HAD-IIA family hydrolase [Verrucomicrobiota bacterium]